ncbi:MAG: hypothetical protein LKE47_07505 [Prevotella sp.]|jgi:hypothetical protein|nr:hypothetical protein [Prevotella sp.]MCH3970216.1 hypothetical protein [Prevotella sp.]
MKYKILPFLIFILGLVSCTDDLDTSNINQSELNDSIRIDSIDNESLYRLQTNKGRILYSFILYNKTSKKYELDLSDKDTIDLGINKRDIEQVKKYIRQMNLANIKYQQ